MAACTSERVRMALLEGLPIRRSPPAFRPRAPVASLVFPLHAGDEPLLIGQTPLLMHHLVQWPRLLHALHDALRAADKAPSCYGAKAAAGAARVSSIANGRLTEAKRTGPSAAILRPICAFSASSDGQPGSPPAG